MTSTTETTTKKVVKLKQKNRSDLFIILAVCVLAAFGIIMVSSAGYYIAINEHGDELYFLKRHTLWVFAGFVGMFVCSKIDYHFWTRPFFKRSGKFLDIPMWMIMYVIGLLLLVAVFIPGLGTTAYGAERWIYIGPISIMPGEVSKAPLLFALTGYFVENREKIAKKPYAFLWGIVIPGCMTGLYVLFIMLQPNMSTAFTLVFMMAGIMFIAGCKAWQWAVCLGVGAATGVAMIIANPQGYRFQRLLSFIDPFADRLGFGWNAVQSLFALSSGGLIGKGIGNSVQKNLYLPMPQNDFILAVIGEEFGFFGILALMAVYIFLIYRGCLTSLRAKDMTGTLMAAGIVLLIGFQTLVHFAVVTSWFPPTGITLPFISYGGNATLLFMSLAGILLNISKQANK